MSSRVISNSMEEKTRAITSTKLDDFTYPKKKSSLSEIGSDLVVATNDGSSRSLAWLKPNSQPSTQGSFIANISRKDKSSPGSVLKLLASKITSRPQTLFSTPPDNSHEPFRPLLKEKPNSLLENDDWRTNIMQSVGIDYPHPYNDELTEFEHVIQLKFKSYEAKSLLPPRLEDTTFKFVDEPNDLTELVSQLSLQPEIAVDLEHHNYRTYFGMTCLIQISTRSADYILDSLALRDHLHILNKPFTNPNIVKVAGLR
ncbi:unnamed protein product [Protopolystoma xenopodis]|uniref:3'-5' exonuclease domain-containing protein n=1 Tax=Protopolystoma xenopodis TaxID=117903 RepID=A0A3S4ZXW3_9PLAT|nr:unnamed protein product [Protopolystoma xenopodis]